MHTETAVLKERIATLQNALEDKENAQIELVNRLQEELAVHKQKDLEMAVAAGKNHSLAPSFTKQIEKL